MLTGVVLIRFQVGAKCSLYLFISDCSDLHAQRRSARLDDDRLVVRRPFQTPETLSPYFSCSLGVLALACAAR